MLIWPDPSCCLFQILTSIERHIAGFYMGTLCGRNVLKLNIFMSITPLHVILGNYRNNPWRYGNSPSVLYRCTPCLSTLLYMLIRSYSSQRNGETFRKQYKVQIYKIKRTAKRKLSFDALRERGGGGINCNRPHLAECVQLDDEKPVNHENSVKEKSIPRRQAELHTGFRL